MHKEEFANGKGWLMLREPSEITNAGRRMVRAAIGAVGTSMEELVKLQVANLASLGLDEGQAPTAEQVDETMGKAAVALGADESTLEQMMSLNDAALVAVIAGWSLDVPVSRQSIDDLPVGTYDAVAEAGKVAAAAVMANLSVDFSITTADPASLDPTGASPA